jgi:cell division septum initiation protein DivIVA
MPKTKKRVSRNGSAKTNDELTRELAAVKREVRQLREKCREAYRAVLAMCCPKEWYTEEVDVEKLRAEAIFEPSIKEIINSLK